MNRDALAFIRSQPSIGYVVWIFSNECVYDIRTCKHWQSALDFTITIHEPWVIEHDGRIVSRSN